MKTTTLCTMSLAAVLVSPLLLASGCAENGAVGTSQQISHSESDKTGWFGGQTHQANTAYKNSDGSTSIESETTTNKNGTTNGQWNVPGLRKLLDELLAANGELSNYQLEHDFPDVGQRTMLLNGRELDIDDKNTKLILLAIQDVTERQQAERLLRISEIRYRRLFEAAHDGILILNTSTLQITDVNPFLLRLLDYPREHFIGKELWEIGIFRDKDANRKAMLELQDNGAIRFEDLPLRDRNGRRHPVEIVANVYQEDHQSVIQCNIRDIGERVLFERERTALLANEQAARMEAEAANRSKDLFLATLSHEVRTPLNAIMGWASILRSGKCTQAEVQEGMEVIERNCRAQAQLIEDVLDVSRIVSGKMPLNIAPCDLVAVINAAIDTARPAADAKGIRFETDLAWDASHASYDANRIQQVIWNLLANAVKFTPHASAVRIVLRHDRSTAQIQIKDEGQGIKPEFLPYVFERFRQAEGSTRRKLGGLGLGLSIVRHIVELHGGTVHAASAGEGKGATFTVNLPLRESPIEPAESPGVSRTGSIPAPHPAPISLDGIRVLVVDDDADARRLLSKVLVAEGGIVTTAVSVIEAIHAIETERPDVLISDIAMPFQDGYDLIRQVRDVGLTSQDLPAVAVTAYAHKEDQRRALLAGFQVHVAKPINPHELIAIVAKLAGRRTGQPA